MEFLKAILGEELYKQVESKINEYNGTPDNKEKQVKLANLGEGGYVGKDKYAALETTHNSKLEELKQANALIEDYKKSSKGNEEAQAKIAAYDTKVKELEAQLEKEKVDSAIKVALLEAKAKDIDYLTFKLGQEKAEFKLDENGKVTGLQEQIDGLKTKYPDQFTASGNPKPIPNPLPSGDGGSGSLSKADFLKKPYAERAKLFQENPEAFKEIMK